MWRSRSRFSLVSGNGESPHGMHVIARFSAESVRLSGVSATRNSFVRSVEFPVNRMVNETNERNKPVRFVRPKGSFIRTGSRTNEPTIVPTIFNFSGYSAGDTDRPVKSDPGAALMRRERVQKRACQAEEREVNLASSTRETEKLVHSLFEDCLVCRLAPCS